MATASATAGGHATFGGLLTDLTTVFDPPCPVTWLLTTTKVPSQLPAFPTTGPASCDPPSWIDNISQKGFAYYSPAVCPAGFTAACTVNDERTTEGFPAITAGETAMYCVPNGFTCTSDTTDFHGGVWGFMRTASASGASVTVGPAMQIRWREGDLSDVLTSTLTISESSTQSVRVFPTSDTESLISTTTTRERTGLTTTETSPTESESNSITTASDTPTRIESSSQANQPDPTTSDQVQGTPAVESGTAPSSSVASSTNTAAIAMSGILIFLILVMMMTATLRRYRRYRGGKVATFIPIGIVSWTKNLLARRKQELPLQRVTGMDLSEKLGAELGTDGPTPELGPGNPLGTKENPAELAGGGTRNSWMSHVSRIFTVRLKRDVSSV
ncbi:hypothetical protein M426DRAFT_16297 [Hypoxylon sp. CI-4A]|nr:hypothetical protein M426DRAFT_16297 [Hypoxylon sp. CI-4A]